jgi:hypothetical protein
VCVYIYLLEVLYSEQRELKCIKHSQNSHSHFRNRSINCTHAATLPLLITTHQGPSIPSGLVRAVMAQQELAHTGPVSAPAMAAQ